MTPGTPVQIKVPRFLLTSFKPYRYNQAGVETIYLGEGEDAAAAEIKQHPGLNGFARKATPPDSVFHVDVELSGVLDLTDPGIHAKLGTDLAELTSAWRPLSPGAPTQLLGAATVADGRFEAIRYPCAPLHNAGAKGVCLVVFRGSILSGSSVSVHDPLGNWSEEFR